MNFISLEPSPQQPNLNQKKVFCATKTVLGACMIVSFLVIIIQVVFYCKMQEPARNVKSFLDPDSTVNVVSDNFLKFAVNCAQFVAHVSGNFLLISVWYLSLHRHRPSFALTYPITQPSDYLELATYM